MKNIRPIFGILLALHGATAILAQSTTNGVFSGTTSDEQGSRVAANVYFQRLFKSYRPSPASNHVAPLLGEIEVRSLVATDPGGVFQVTDLPAGAYLVCAHPSDDQYVDPCDWGPPAQVLIGDGNSGIASLTSFKAGVRVVVHVFDPQSLLPPANSLLTTPGLIVGVRDAGRKFHIALVKASGQGYRELSVTVPTGAQSTLMVLSHGFVLYDSDGAMIPLAGQSTALQIPNKAGTIAINLTAVARR